MTTLLHMLTVVQWTDSPGLDLLELSVGHTLRVEYSKGADIGFTNGQLRVIPRYITAGDTLQAA